MRCHVSATDLGSTLGGAGSFLIRADAVIGVDGIAPRRPHIFLSGTICLAGFVTYHKELSSGCTSSKILLPLRLMEHCGSLAFLATGGQTVSLALPCPGHASVLLLQCICKSSACGTTDQITQNHTIFNVGRDLCRSSSLTLLSREGHVEHIA